MNQETYEKRIENTAKRLKEEADKHRNLWEHYLAGGYIGMAAEERKCIDCFEKAVNIVMGKI